MKANACASFGGELGFLSTSINSILSSSSIVNCCFLFLITSFLSHLGISYTRDLPLEDEGFFLAILFPLSLLFGVFSFCERSTLRVSISVEFTVLSLVSWEICWGCSLICPSFDTSLVDTCCGSSSCYKWTCSIYVPRGRGVVDPLSTQNVTCNWNAKTTLGPFNSRGI